MYHPCLYSSFVSNAFPTQHASQSRLRGFMWPVCYFEGKEKRVEGQVPWQAARLIFSVLCQPPHKTLKSVMLTSCNRVTLHRHKTRRQEEGRGEQGLRQSSRNGEAMGGGGLKRNRWRQRKNPKYIQYLGEKKNQPKHPTPSWLTLFLPCDYIKNPSLLIHLFSARENLPKCHDKGGGGLWGRPEESFTRQATLIYGSQRLH